VVVLGKSIGLDEVSGSTPMFLNIRYFTQRTQQQKMEQYGKKMERDQKT
jgi:hypothetical protein